MLKEAGEISSNSVAKSNTLSPPPASPTDVVVVTVSNESPLGSTSTSLASPPALLGEDETYKMLLVIISCLVAVIFACLTLGLLIACR